MKYKLPKSFFFTVSLLFINLKIFSQAPNPAPAPNYAAEPSIQSPNAASLGKFGDIPVSLFTGAPNINIPLTEIKNGSINVPIYLQYDAGGCRPDQHPTWVGLNWSLQAGGVIRRNTNGKFDENVCIYYNTYTNLSDYCGTPASYYDSYTTLNANNWSTLSGRDLSPDEFSFNVNNISGKFMLNHEGKWIVQSKENLNLKVVHEMQTNYSVNFGSGNAILPRSFTKFILTTGDGTQYIFGGQPNAIEFSLPATISFPTYVGTHPPDMPDYSSLDDGWETYIQPSAWHLSEIISPSGNHVTFYYTTDFSFQQTTYFEISGGRQCGVDAYHSTHDINQNNKYLIKSAYLDKIETDNGLICSFSKSISNELNWVFKSKSENHDYFMMKPSYSWRYHKLDGIEVKTNNKTTKKIALEYIEKNTERLKLKAVKFLSLSGNQTESIYRMEYNDKLLPLYNSGMEDHWGFYNGTNYWGTINKQNGDNTVIFQNPNMMTDYSQSRESNPALMDAEIIKRIIYPTGGYSEFTFEPHNYSKLVKQNPNIALQTLSVNKIAGGLRIKKIDTYDAFSIVPQVKEYFYTNDYINGGLFSSGVLSGEPLYYESGELISSGTSFPFYKFSSNPLNYLNTTNGNHITYSQVTEKSSEGYIVYSYTNQDNGYLDKNPFAQSNVYNLITSNPKKLFGKLDLERGQLIDTKYYAADKFLLKKVSNQYNDDPARYNTYVRSNQDVTDAYVCGYKQISFPIYTFYPYLKNQTIEEYFRNGTLTNTSTSYTYDSSSNLLRTTSVINSEGNEIKTRYKYPIDYANVPLAPIPATDEAHDIAALQINNIVNVPVEVNNSIVKGGVEYITGGKLNYFENLKLEKILELEVNSLINSNSFNFSTINTSGFLSDSKYKEKISFPRYDDKGNLLEIQPRGSVSTSYLWAYNKTYPVAKIVNSTYNQIETLLGITVLNSLSTSYNDIYIKSVTDQLRQELPDSQVYSYTYNPSIGILSESSPNNNTKNYYYDIFGRLDLVKDNLNKVIKDYKYNYKQVKRISLSTNNLSFENVPYGTSVSKNIRVTNSSSLSFTISGLTVPSGYTYTVNGSNTLAPGESVDITIVFSPSVAGSYSGTITVLSDAQGFNTIAVNGSGVISKIINISGDLNFGWMFAMPGNPYGCSFRTMTITNSGNTILTITGIQVGAPFAVNWTNGTIAPGQSKNVTVSFCPPSNPYYSYDSTINVFSDKTAGINTFPVSGAAETTN
ncbi:choice-of-anchor D domain-containing protein [Flavobacterium ajazii]|uniref:choice-of-anchor D domain-containing protein n=1 Tax=Flavobacterium ajazii TaxID=2692318 RepID=UPI0013CFC338|nr:choice-of-anchor D domain-containing protein [Flavobacterium ajazii]